MSLTVSDALTEGHIYVALQPIVDLSAMAVFAYEALVRCRAPEFPNALSVIEAAQKERFLGRLGRALRRMAVEACSSHPLFLNIHPDEFDEGWLVRPDDAMAMHPSDIYLEITETVPLSHYRFCHSVLREIRSKGIKLAVDDLGAGYSNLKYIADLSPEIVKLDRMLIAGLSQGSRLHQLVTSIVKLCEEQGAKVVAEGIETAEELRAVITTGAHYVQGFFLARPAHPAPPIDRAALLAAL